MLEIHHEFIIEAKDIVDKSNDELIDTIIGEVKSAIAKKIREKIDTEAIVEMEPSEDPEGMKISTDLIVYSKQEIQTAIERISVVLVQKYGLTADQVEEVLNPLIETFKDW